MAAKTLKEKEETKTLPQKARRPSLKKVLYPLISISVILLVVIPIILKKSDEVTTFKRILMGTTVEITLKEDNQRAANKAFDEIARLEGIFSSYDTTSVVSRITGLAGKGWVSVPPEVIEVLDIALYISRLSDGAFDPTFGTLGKLWDFSPKTKKKLPTKREIRRLSPLVNYKAVLMGRVQSVVMLDKLGMTLNLGGVAKGYIVGRAFEALREEGIEWAIIKAGGEITTFSDKEDELFEVGVQDPRNKDGIIGTLSIPSGAVSTSGDYERFFIKDDVRYHHIIDTTTGYPARGLRAVTIVSKDPTLADALSTAVFVMGRETGMKLIEGLEGVEGLIVDTFGEITLSSGLKDKFSLVKTPKAEGITEAQVTSELPESATTVETAD